MKVYIVNYVWRGEPEMIGVFSNKEVAQTWVDSCGKNGQMEEKEVDLVEEN